LPFYVSRRLPPLAYTLHLNFDVGRKDQRSRGRSCGIEKNDFLSLLATIQLNPCKNSIDCTVSIRRLIKHEQSTLVYSMMPQSCCLRAYNKRSWRLGVRISPRMNRMKLWREADRRQRASRRKEGATWTRREESIHHCANF
jgi:hypothetical protein